MDIIKIIEENKKIINLKENNVKPMFLFLGGMPGSGKTLLTKKVKNKYYNRDFVIIEADLYRKYLDINYEDRYNAVDKTIIYSNYIEESLLNYAIEQQKDIISISSFRSKETMYKIINNKLLINNYIINCEIIVTNRIESILSSLERYVDYIKNVREIPRLVKIDYFKLCSKAFEDTVVCLSNSSSINQISMYRRGNNFSLPIEFFNNKTNLDIKKVLIQEEKSQFDNLDNKKILKRLDNAECYLRNNNSSNEEQKELKKIRLYIENSFDTEINSI